jgi:uncharacterized membrane protein
MERAMANPKSIASIAGHPLHPMLIPFLIAFLVAAFAFDVAFWQTANTFWASASVWLLGAGIVMAALAAVAGLIDMLGEARIRVLNAVWWHAGGNVLVVLIQLYNWFARYTQETTAVVPKGLILSLLVVGILLFTGWKGWEMVYGVRRFRRGGTAPPSRNVECSSSRELKSPRCGGPDIDPVTTCVSSGVT